jgi:tetratricopeptide (TPR) repeat protein
MRPWACVVFCLLLGACTSAPVAEPPAGLFEDQLFRPPSERISADDVFALSNAMRHYLATEIADKVRLKGRQQGLFDALYAKGELQLNYDSTMTRNAAEAFAARSGNCLSLVIMTAAFAKAMGLPVRYQSAYLDETWSREDDIYFFIGHVNLSLGKRPFALDFGHSSEADELMIDFLSPFEIRGLRTREIAEPTIVAMYMNNRAAEALARGQLDDAYGWARAAIKQDSGFLSSYNTLGVIYQRQGHLDAAERVLSFAVARNPTNTHAMSNLAEVLSALGRVPESRALAAKLERMEPNPPFSFFSEGLSAMRARNFEAARDLFAKEVDRAPYYHEFHFWLAAAYIGLGQSERARKELNLAIETSPAGSDRELYAAKLERIRAHTPP